MTEFGLFDPAPWRSQAACRGVAPGLMFPERGEKVDAAKAVCAGCPVRAECLSYAMTLENTTSGVWGGTSDRERRQIRARSHLAVAKARPKGESDDEVVDELARALARMDALGYPPPRSKGDAA